MMATDAAMAPVWTAVNLLLLWAGWRAGRRLVPDPGPPLRVCQLLLFWWGSVVLAAVTVGAAGLLTGPTLLAAGLLWGAVLLAVATRAGRTSTVQPAAPSSPGPPCGSGDQWFGEGFWRVVWGGWLAWMIGRVVTDGLLAFPAEWDTLMYHLPLVDQWLQAGSLYAPDDAVWYNAANSELVGLWLVAPFSGDFLVGLTNLPALLLLAAAGVELGRELGLGCRLSHVTSLAVSSTPVVFRQALEAKNDIAVAALFVATLAFGLRFAREGRSAHLPYAAAAFGLLCGVKYFAVGYAGVAWAGLAGLCWVTRGRRPAAALAGATALGGVFWAGYWYARNFWVTGTPVYPKGLGGRTDVILDVQPRLWETTLLGNNSPDVLPMLTDAVRSMAGPCHLAGFLLLPALAGWLCASGAWSWGVAGRVGDGGRRFALVGLIVGSGLVFGLSPFAVETVPGTLNMLRQRYLPARFGLCFLSLGVLALALVAQDVSRLARGRPARGRPWRVALAAAPPTLFGFAAAYQLYATSTLRMKGNSWDSLLVGGSLFAFGLIVLLLRDLSSRTRRWSVAVAAIALCGAASWGAYELGRQWHAGFAEHYDRTFGGQLFRTLERVDTSKTRVCVLGDRYYPFFGSRRLVPVSRPSYLQTREQALEYLQRRRATLVAVLSKPSSTAGGDRFDRRGDWLADHPDVFRPLDNVPGYYGAYYHVWKVDQAALERLLASGRERWRD